MRGSQKTTLRQRMRLIQIFPKPLTDAWADYLEKHTIKGKLRIARFDKSMGLVQRKRNQTNPDEVLKLGGDFCFHLNSNIKGRTVAFQLYDGIMHSRPRGVGEEPSVVIQRGEQFLLLDENGKPDELTEMNDLVQHRFVIAIVYDAEDLPTSTQPPSQNSGIDVHILAVQFVS